VPTGSFDPDAAASVATPYLLGESGVSDRVRETLANGGRVAVTEGLADRLVDESVLDHERARIVETGGDPESLLSLDRADLAALREHLLAPLDVTFDAPPGVCLHLFGEDDPRVVVQNTTDDAVAVDLSVGWDLEERLTVPGNADVDIRTTDDGTTVEIAARSLVVL
jgi:hypothetical protein